MQNSIPNPAPRQLAGMTTGALVLTVFGAIWGMQGPQIMIVITPIVAIALLAFGLTTKQAVRRLPQEQVTPEEQAQDRRISKHFGIIVVGEFVAIAVSVVLFRFFGHPEFIMHGTCLIVGLHFLPLASIFRFRLYALVGAVLSFLGVGAMLALLFGFTFGDPSTWSIIVGLSAAGILWVTSLFILVKVRQLLRLKLDETSHLIRS